MRQVIARAAGAALLTSLIFAGAVAATPPVAGCPTGGEWELFEPRHEQHLDLNGDRLICRLMADGELITWRDNNVRER